MSQISLLMALSRDGVAKLADQSAFRLAPDEMERAAEWAPGTEIIIQPNSNDDTWQYKLWSSGGGLPVRAAPVSPGS